MLVLTRLAGESIVIDHEIHIRVLKIEDGHVRIGIDAPADKTIYREELYLEIQNENKLAGKANLEVLSSFTNGALQ
ncbi:MAG: carbon storage regulator CsrA, partial [Aliifodinibius sp.]|nr:carbon storage regulator CsrA [candidate division Zixibacteria bacterium]NIT55024.1 carbon storage regulator CsrA [Fodinibius sp.]NIW43425.1 carbon storage regulator CsrA [Gammaproteobacteria bacterium]NIS44583.1 carbon storage regulator CsrA [candidate division Zixibacteria bacterium]NIU12641.1 carbon storage regulator CsrA [candidate division Zixibacteria bacterium]